MYLIRFMCGDDWHTCACDWLKSHPCGRCHAYCAYTYASFVDRHVRSSSIIYQRRRRNETILFLFLLRSVQLFRYIFFFFFMLLNFQTFPANIRLCVCARFNDELFFSDTVHIYTYYIHEEFSFSLLPFS